MDAWAGHRTVLLSSAQDATWQSLSAVVRPLAQVVNSLLITFVILLHYSVCSWRFEEARVYQSLSINSFMLVGSLVFFRVCPSIYLSICLAILLETTAKLRRFVYSYEIPDNQARYHT